MIYIQNCFKVSILLTPSPIATNARKSIVVAFIGTHYSSMIDYRTYLQTAVVAFGGMIAILCLIMGLERTIRIIMANYLIASIILWLGNFIQLISSRLLIGPAERWVDGFQKRTGQLLLASRPTVLLAVYALLLIFITTKSHIGIGKVRQEAVRVTLLIVFIPCAVISILFNLSLAIYGNQIINLDELKLLADNFSNHPFAHNIVMLTPLWIILPGIVTIAVAAFVLRTKDEIIRREIWGKDDKEEKEKDDEK